MLMRTGISFTVSIEDRSRLEAVVSTPSSPQKHVWRSRIVLLSADGLGTTAIMAATGKSKTCVWRWQERFMTEGVEGLLREKTRPPGTPRTPDEKVAEVIRLTQEPPPHEATHWTVRAMGKAVGLAASTVREIWKAHGLSPHRWRQFKLSNDRAFAEKLHDVVGLYVAPPAHAVVLSVDEKSQIQALDRTQPGLPLKKGRGPTMTHDYKRNGTTTLSHTRGITSPTIRREMRRRNAIEPVIGHLKDDGLLERNHLAGPEGDAINVILCAAGHNMRLLARWLRVLLSMILAAVLRLRPQPIEHQPPAIAA
jgi:transposase